MIKYRYAVTVIGVVFIYFIPLFLQAQAGPIDGWISALKKNPNDVEALKHIGTYCYENGKTDIAIRSWSRAYKLQPSDPQAWYYLGSLLELENKTSQALAFFSRYGEAPKSSAYREVLEGRYRLLSREAVKAEMHALLAQEDLLGSQPPSPQTVAVFPFEYRGINAKLSPLGKGLAEMVMTDLSQVKDLKVVERLRVQALMDEIRLGQSGMVKQDSAPAFGKMLKAGKIVYGHFTLQNKNRLALDVTYADAVENTMAEPFEFSDAIANLFLIEKDAVFKVIGQMGISLTAQEKERIQRIPTKNLLAFVNYCLGLEMEDKGEFEQAAQFYQKSLQLDPNYSSAQQKLQTNQLIVSAKAGFVPSASASKDRQAVPNGDVPKTARTAAARSADTQMLIQHRMDMLHQNMGSHFVTSTDTRNSPVADAIRQNENELLKIIGSDNYSNFWIDFNPLHFDHVETLTQKYP